MQSNLAMRDRVLRSIFVALAVGMGWGIRGDFGFVTGAMYPGAVLGLAFAYVSGPGFWRWMPILAAVSGWGIGQGGRMSYAVLHGYAQSDTFINYTYGLFTLFLQGGAWGTFGCAMIGLLLETRRVTFLEWLVGIFSVFGGGYLFYYLIVGQLRFHVNPPRSDASIAYVGGVTGLFCWLVASQRHYGLKGAFFGFIGFGLGMSCGRVLGNFANDFTTWQLGSWGAFSINHWNVMETSVGLIGSFIFAFGMLGKRAPELPQCPVARGLFHVLSIAAAFYVLGGIPWLHWRDCIKPAARLADWSKSLAGWGFANPEELARENLLALKVIVGLGFAGACLWLVLDFRDASRFAWLPALWLSLIMLLFQNVAALFFFYPHRSQYVNMHWVFWVLFGLMVLHVILIRPRDVADADEVVERWHWKGWAVAAVSMYVVAVACTTFTNGPTTMKSANTRWPEWNWREGPYPGKVRRSNP